MRRKEKDQILFLLEHNKFRFKIKKTIGTMNDLRI